MENQEQEYLSYLLEVDMVNASALMEGLELLDGKSEDYRRGFFDGYQLNRENVEVVDEIFRKRLEAINEDFRKRAEEIDEDSRKETRKTGG